MQHVRVRDHDVRAGADGLARVLRRVPVVGEGADVRAQRLDRPRAARRAGPAPAPSSETGTARARPDPSGCGRGPAGCSRGSCPTRSGVTTTVSRPPRAASYASRWWRVEPARSPRPARTARSFGCRSSGKSANCGGLGREVPQRRQHGLAAQRLLDLEGLQDREQPRLRPHGVRPAARSRTLGASPPGGRPERGRGWLRSVSREVRSTRSAGVGGAGHFPFRRAGDEHLFCSRGRWGTGGTVSWATPEVLVLVS